MYKSLFKLDGKPILPPLMTAARVSEMQMYRQLAIEKEKRLEHRRSSRDSRNESLNDFNEQDISTLELDSKITDYNDFEEKTVSSLNSSLNELELSSRTQTVVCINKSNHSNPPDDPPEREIINDDDLDYICPIDFNEFQERNLDKWDLLNTTKRQLEASENAIQMLQQTMLDRPLDNTSDEFKSITDGETSRCDTPSKYFTPMRSNSAGASPSKPFSTGKSNSNVILPVRMNTEVLLNSPSEQGRPKFVRSNSYTMEKPSPLFIKHMELRGVNICGENSKTESLTSGSVTPKSVVEQKRLRKHRSTVLSKPMAIKPNIEVEKRNRMKIFTNNLRKSKQRSLVSRKVSPTVIGSMKERNRPKKSPYDISISAHSFPRGNMIRKTPPITTPKGEKNRPKRSPIENDKSTKSSYDSNMNHTPIVKEIITINIKDENQNHRRKAESPPKTKPEKPKRTSTARECINFALDVDDVESRYKLKPVKINTDLFANQNLDPFLQSPELLNEFINRIEENHQIQMRELMLRQEEEQRKMQEIFSRQQESLLAQIKQSIPSVLQGKTIPVTNTIAETPTVNYCETESIHDSLHVDSNVDFLPTHLSVSSTSALNNRDIPPVYTDFCGNDNLSFDTITNKSLDLNRNSNTLLQKPICVTNSSTNLRFSSDEEFSSTESNTKIGKPHLTPIVTKNRDDPYNDMKVKNEAATVIQAQIRGYLTRRLFNTEKVQLIINTIKDTLMLILDLHYGNTEEVAQSSDRDLKLRLMNQLSSACYKLHDVFFDKKIKAQMDIIAKDRALNMRKLNKSFSDTTGLAINNRKSIQNLQKCELFSVNINGKEQSSVSRRMHLKKSVSCHNFKIPRTRSAN